MIPEIPREAVTPDCLYGVSVFGLKKAVVVLPGLCYNYGAGNKGGFSMHESEDYSFELQDHFFNWDKNKNLSNIQKHGISFKEAAGVFLDARATLIADEEHSQDEDRYIVIGISGKLKLLMVCHCYKNEGETIRIISARKATREEENIYENA